MKTILNVLNPEFYCTLALSILNGIVLISVAYRFFQIVQLYGYRLSGFFKWQKQTKFKYLTQLFFLSLLSFGGLLVFNIVFASFKISGYFAYIGLLFYFSLIFVFVKQLKKEIKKTPLKETKRMKRLKICFFIVNVLVSFWIIIASSEFAKYIRFGTVAFTPILLFVVFPIVFYMELPLEILIQKCYLAKAKRRLNKLEQIKPKIKIGITGSFGKTSTKIILAGILSEKFKVSYSPASYNTPMGLTKFILKTVKEDDEIIIAEMGARKPKDIKKLCDIIKPDIGIITSIGEQHMESFKTIDNIVKTKFEIVQFSKPNAKIFIGDDKELKKIYLKIKKEKYCTSDKKSSGYFAYAENLITSTEGTSFTLVINREKIDCKTKLLGEHNIENIVLASSVAFKLGVGLEEIKKGIEKLSPIEHRLQLIKSKNGVNVLDDSYNSSPQGSKRALNVLSQFEGKTKWVMTPGLIEQGKNQVNANFEFGKNIAKVADFIIVVNKINKIALGDGIVSTGFKTENLFFADSLEKAQDIISKKVDKDSVILIENDLPDNFV